MKAADFGTLADRFWAKVDRGGDCWLWTGEKNRHGYGRFDLWHEGKRTRIFAHRLVLRLIGEPPGDDQVVMHICDNPPCVNPGHLRVGTQADNMQDAVAKGRADLSGLRIGVHVRWARHRAAHAEVKS